MYLVNTKKISFISWRFQKQIAHLGGIAKKSSGSQKLFPAPGSRTLRGLSTGPSSSSLWAAFASSWRTSTSQDADSFSINSSITLLHNVLITAISRYGVRVNLTAWMSVRVLIEKKIQVLGGNSYHVNVILDKVLWSHLTGDWSLFPALYLMFYTNVPILLSLLLVYRIPDIICSYKNRGSQKSSCSTQIRQCSYPSYSSSDTSELF